MIKLPTVSVVAVTTKDYGKTIEALKKTLQQIEPLEVLYYSDVPYIDPDGKIKHVMIDRFKSVEDYNHFIFKHMVHYTSVHASHVLVVQHDGYVINGSAWKNEFLQYDYIGAPWTYTDGRNVGNGGFSLRSVRLHAVLLHDEFEFTSPEDEKICRYYRQTLEKVYDINFAPDDIAHQFSFEMHPPRCKTFGFHNYFFEPYKDAVVLQRRDSAMGDMIMMEPVMAWFFDHGYRVILDCPRHYYNLFSNHYFKIEHIQDIHQYEDRSNWREINLDMAYEVTPKRLALESYYEVCGIKDGVLRNPKLNFSLPETRKEVKLFDKYIVLHIDDTEMPHRNVHGVDWEEVANYIQVFCGYPVFRVGKGNGKGGQKINTYSENMLAYVVANADYFIGIDSGVAQVAVGCDVKSMIFFGSVFPAYRYIESPKITVMQKGCPAVKDGCYHEVVSTVGQDCEVDVKTPPCITWRTKEVIESIKMFIQ